MSDIAEQLRWGCVLKDEAWERGVDVGQTDRILRQAADEIIRLRTELAEAQAELTTVRLSLAAAEAIIAKLPKTADGVPILVDMNLYSPVVDYDFGCIAIREYDPETAEIECRDVRGVEFWMAASDCFSTREAAEAAQHPNGGRDE